MVLSLKRRAAAVAVAGVLGVAGTACAAAPASAAYHVVAHSSGAAVPVGTAYTAKTDSSGFSLVNTANQKIVTCSSSTLGGATINSPTTSPAVSNALSVSSGSLSKCKFIPTNQTVVITETFSTSWQINPLTGSGPVGVKMMGVNMTWECAGNSQTYTGTLNASGDVTKAFEINDSTASSVTFNNASSVTNTSSSGSGCGLPSSFNITAKYVLTTVGGVQVTPSNNWYFLQ